MFKVTMIVPAAGAGTRMKQQVPKTLLPLLGKPVLYWTLKRCVQLQFVRQILLPVSDSIKAQVQHIVDDLKKEYATLDVSFELVQGGSERIYSIYNCIPFIASDSSIIAVHDAVRPFFDIQKTLDCLEVANKSGAAILALPLRETIKEIDSNKVVVNTPNRSKYWSIQTPQCFQKKLFIDAYAHAIKQNYFGTDDASLVEFLGEKVEVTEGNDENIKITYPIDLALAELIISRNNQYKET